MKRLVQISVCLNALIIPFLSISQNIKNINYSIEKINNSNVALMGAPLIQANNYTLFRLDVSTLMSGLNGVTYREGEINGFVAEIELPHTDGTTKHYSVKRNQTLHPELNAKFNDIRTFDAYALDGSGAFCKWDITPHGLHAMIMIPGESTIFIDPYIAGNTEYYIVYRKKDFITNKLMDCSFEYMEEEIAQKENNSNIKAMFGSCDLRTYRLALAATGEYTTFHGGTVALSQAAQVTSMNRVNGVYEKDMAITMVIVPNNNLIIYTNSGSDPYTNGTPGTMIGQNQTTCDNIIGSANYDIGHVFGTNSGGLAGLGVVCTGSQKARGVTGSSAPIGDPFDIDYVAHEMGHQFGANHTQNNACNSVAAARHEPGSASTIMGYAGICSPNVQSNSDDYFHGYNLGEISVEILSTGHQCEVITALNNTAPTISSTNANISVPISTPFALTASATDPDGDVLTYLWEQMNNQASTQPPVSTATGGPNFRSFDPSLDSTRYFPNLQSLSSNGPFTWEVLPSVSRTMNFRLTVKDNHAVGACNDYVNVTVATVATAGPFIVSYPSATGISWAANGTQTVTWDVANTDLTPINCSSVRILLSTDGGLTYPTELSSGTTNDGSELITVPNVSTTTARIMVISNTGTFFDISNNNFAITACTPPDLATINATQPECFGDQSALTVTAGNLNDAQQWEWYSGTCNGTVVGTGLALTVTPSTTTTYFVSGNGGCSGSVCAEITVVVPSELNNQVNQTGIQLTAVQNGVDYQWIDCNAGNSFVLGADQQSYTPTEIAGSYAVIVSLGNCADTSNCFLIDQTGLDELDNAQITLFPNPFTNEVTIKWEELKVDFVEMTDAFGRIVSKNTVTNTNSFNLSAENSSVGIYFVRLIGENGTYTRRLIKQ